MEALFSGGGQERGLRSGTLAPGTSPSPQCPDNALSPHYLTRIPAALCVGMGEAARLCSQDMEYDAQWISFLSQKLLR